MIHFLELAMGFIAGVFLGGIYFGGLWWTVRRLPHARHFWQVYAGGLLARLALAMLTFYLELAYGGWQSLIACLFGFIASRLVLTQMLGRRQSVCSVARVIR